MKISQIGFRNLGFDNILGKRYVAEKEYIHMISSYITADWSIIE